MAKINEDLKSIIDKHKDWNYISHKIQNETLYILFQEKESQTGDGALVLKHSFITDDETLATVIEAVIEWKLDLNEGWTK